ncbi:hypothetical protein [Actinoplanes sp. NPDC089786]|uniref:hypothetical protein n=1 Tax=Actinoplanes sp. NPDC089786 TaxID=3155185 RepID=UPI00342F7D9D
MTSQEPETPHSADSGIPDTEVLAVPSAAPVFVDESGRRSKLLRRVAYGFGALCMLYGGLVSVSLAGGPVSSSAVLPLPELGGDDSDDTIAGPAPAPPMLTPPPGSQPPRLLTESLRRPDARSIRDTRRAEAPRATATTRATATKAPVRITPTVTKTARPLESGSASTTPKPSRSPVTPGPTTPAPETTPTTPPVPPNPPVPGGTGGGATSGDSGAGTGGSGGGGSVNTPPPAPPKLPPAPPKLPPAPTPTVREDPAPEPTASGSEPSGKSEPTGPGEPDEELPAAEEDA